MSDPYTKHVEVCAVCREGESFCSTGIELLGAVPALIKVVSMEHDNIVYEVAAQAGAKLDSELQAMIAQSVLKTVSASSASMASWKSPAKMIDEMKFWKDQILGAFKLTEKDLPDYSPKEPQLNETYSNKWARQLVKPFNFGTPNIWAPLPTGHKPSEPEFQHLKYGMHFETVKPILPNMDYSPLELRVAHVTGLKTDCPACAAGIPGKKVTFTKPDPTKDLVLVKKEPIK